MSQILKKLLDDWPIVAATCLLVVGFIINSWFIIGLSSAILVAEILKELL